MTERRFPGAASARQAAARHAGRPSLPRTALHLCLLIAFATGTLACEGGSADAPAAGPGAEAKPSTTPAAAPASAQATGPAILNPNTQRMAASHILVAYGGAVAARSTVTRTKEEAKTRAEEALAKVQGGADFALIARAYSDDSTGPRGGRLGTFDPGTMVAPFEAAAKELKVGEISALVETPFGYHVIRRDALVEIRGGHLYISWVGATGAPSNVTRTREQADARMALAVAALQAGTDWREVVLKYSDGPLKEDGGDLGWFGRNQLAAQLDAAVFALGVGEVSPAIETPSGLHMLKRME